MPSAAMPGIQSRRLADLRAENACLKAELEKLSSKWAQARKTFFGLTPLLRACGAPESRLKDGWYLDEDASKRILDEYVPLGVELIHRGRAQQSFFEGGSERGKDLENNAGQKQARQEAKQQKAQEKETQSQQVDSDQPADAEAQKEERVRQKLETACNYQEKANKAAREAVDELTEDTPEKKAVQDTINTEFPEKPSPDKTVDPDTRPADNKKTAGRLTLKGPQKTIGRDGGKPRKCSNCDCERSMEPLSAVLNRVLGMSDQLRDLIIRAQIYLWIYVCSHCGHIEVDIPEDADIPVNLRSSISLRLVVMACWFWYQAIPMNRFETLFLADKYRVGHTALPNAIEWFCEHCLNLIIQIIREQLQKAAAICADGTSFRMLDIEGRGVASSRITDPDSQRNHGWVLAIATPKNAQVQVRLYVPMDGRTIDDVSKALNLSPDNQVIVADGYACYDSIVVDTETKEHDSSANTGTKEHQACWVHMRRYVMHGGNLQEMLREIAKLDEKKLKEEMLRALQDPTSPYLLLIVWEAIQKIFAYENCVQKQDGESQEAYLARVQENRTKNIAPLMNDIDTLMKKMQPYVTRKKQTGQYCKIVESPLAETVVYYMNHRDQLQVCLTHPEVPLDQSVCERMIRPVAMARHSSLYMQSKEGAQRMCTIYSAIETAKANGIVDITSWLEDFGRAVFRHMLERHCEMNMRQGITVTALRIPRDDRELLEGFDATPFSPLNPKCQEKYQIQREPAMSKAAREAMELAKAAEKASVAEQAMAATKQAASGGTTSASQPPAPPLPVSNPSPASTSA